MSRNGHSNVISVRAARSRYPVLKELLRTLVTSYDKVVVMEAGPLTGAVARSTTRTRGSGEIGFHLVDQGTLVAVPLGKKVRAVARRLNPSHVVQIETGIRVRGGRGNGTRVVRAATVTIYATETTTA